MKKLNLIKKTGCCSSSIDINEEDIDMEFFNGISGIELQKASGYNIDIRGGCEFEKKALWLDNECDYILGKDSDNCTILIPLKKK